MKTGDEKREPPKLQPFTPVFRAAKPFLFLIRHAKTGTILFLGRLVNPGAQSGSLRTS